MSLNVIALISGGKDSLFSLLHCIQNGHKIVALANLYPVSAEPSTDGPVTLEGEDLNSFMYQTVGHTIVPLYAEALDLPLYRRGIGGKTVNTERDYAFEEGVDPDEAEDLIPLLEEIRQAHPEADALSTGAILSTYQRTRIESVAVRLGLTPLAFLWQYPYLSPPKEREDSVTGLLDDMEAAGCDARLIKIASAGMKDSLLWCRVSDPSVKARIIAGMSRFVDGNGSSLRGAVLGEGGEYETLAINGPLRVWKKRIEIDSKSNIVVQDEGGATRLTFGKARLAEQSSVQGDSESPLVRVPMLLDASFNILRQTILQADNLHSNLLDPRDFHAWTCSELRASTSQVLTSSTINNLTSPKLSRNVTEQTIAIIDQLDAILKATNNSQDVTACVAFATILLRRMSDFAAINTLYGKRFNHTNPPARVTICCGDVLPPDVLVSISFTLARAGPARVHGLHVQSISYWAPANIGHYSQAINVPMLLPGGSDEEVVHLAGQIPLIPSSMQLLEQDFLDQAILSLQHLWRVGQCVGVDWWTHGVAYLANAEIPEIHRRAKVAWEIWKGANTAAPNAICEKQDDSEGDTGNFDVWDLKHNHQMQPALVSSKQPTSAHVHKLPNHDVLSRSSSSLQATNTDIPPLLVAHVSSLPRSAVIEWHSLGLARLPRCSTSRPPLTVSTTARDSLSISTCLLGPISPEAAADSDDDSFTQTEGQEQKSQLRAIAFFTIQIFEIAESASSNKGLSLKDQLHLALSRLEQQDDVPLMEGTHWTFGDLTIYVCSEGGYNALNTSGLATMGTLIPCRSLWGEEGRRVAIAVMGRRERASSGNSTINALV
ncbi:hypothetical protein EPUS_06437 [Endocarpon pusillum Z07020]|uniref:Diphthine--ammonia ligase n=1 Tax=Endocarpon pusillum (strain Z07020 / HMAS-L-300199) TaxID=1263415 RepID=U1FTF8_ENDPU|nr:uncharacterized protein EPUS_06437 [Endocarpon pusillum Z07020]ERF68047.1 hypothetical protein EPUS_06437 [Endocarpon pusillum Z07020]